MTPPRPLAAVIRQHAAALMEIDGVTAVGESALPDGQPCVRIYVRERNAALERRLPKTLEGYPVIVGVSGEIRAMPDSNP